MNSIFDHNNGKTRVYICYARVDLSFAARLHNTLASRGYEVFLDRQDIRPGDPWQDRISSAIRHADIVLFCLSPDSVSSQICEWELYEAERYSKWLLPIVLADLPYDQIPGNLKRLNYIFMRGEAEFGVGLEELGARIDRNIVWVRAHANLGELAERWVSADHSVDYLLRGSDLSGYLTWRSSQPAGTPQLTARQLSYLSASEKAQIEREAVAPLSENLRVAELMDIRLALEPHLENADFGSPSETSIRGYFQLPAQLAPDQPLGNAADAPIPPSGRDTYSVGPTPTANRSTGDGSHHPYRQPPPPRSAPRRSRAGLDSSLLAWLGLAAAAAALSYAYGDKLIAWFSSILTTMKLAQPTPIPGASHDFADPPDQDRVDCSIFAPPVAPPNRFARVQVFLHLQEDFQASKQQALELDPKAILQDKKTLRMMISRGAQVDVLLQADDNALTIREPHKTTIWTGEPTSVDFLIRLPADGQGEQYVLDTLIFVDGQPIGEMSILLDCEEVADERATQAQLQSRSATPYKKLFLSYSSKDRRDVALVAQGYDAVEQEFFLDILNLSAGERWERKLYERIDESDLFLLFWSENARQSEWVRREAEHAVKYEAENGRPRILPFPLDGPPPPIPWDFLQDRHFGAPIYFKCAQLRR